MTRSLSLLFVCLFAVAASAAEDAAKLIQTGHYKRARVVLQQRLAANGGDAEALYLMSKAENAFGHPDEATKLAEKAVAAAPQNAEYHVQLGQLYGGEAANASMFRQMSLARSVRHEAETALQLDPKNAEAHYLNMQFMAQAPGIAGGDKNKARKELAEIQKLDPATGAYAEIDLGEALKEKIADPEALYRAAEKAKPGYDTHRRVCAYLINNKRYPEGLACAKALIAADGSRVTGYAYEAIVFAINKDWDALEAVLAESEKAVPDDLAPYFQAGRMIAQNGSDYARADKYLRKYLTQDPEGGEPQLSRAHWRLGQVLEKQGKKPEAIAEFEAAVKLEPKFKPAADDLKRLQSS